MTEKKGLMLIQHAKVHMLAMLGGERASKPQIEELSEPEAVKSPTEQIEAAVKELFRVCKGGSSFMRLDRLRSVL